MRSAIRPKDVFAFLFTEICIENLAYRTGHRAISAKKHALNAEF